MAAKSPFVSKLKKLLREDPRSAIALLEILGPPPGLRGSASPDESEREASPS